MKRLFWLWSTLIVTGSTLSQESLPTLKEGKVPQSVDELWAGYDPRTEPLDVQVVHEWDETCQGKAVKVRMLTFTVGVFKGKVSRIAAYYAYPADVNGKVPGLVQVHGGGQRAEKTTVVTDAANGYACIALNWGGRELEDQKPGDPGTDWGAIDPSQKHVSHYFRLTPDDKTAETVYSPRNNNWFILALATRRGLTFLEQQPAVDAEHLGVYGHSMGGTITGQVAGLDPRIKAAVPSCGGAGITQPLNLARPGSSVDRRVEDTLYSKMIDETASLRNLKHPILGLSPQNDFNCIYDDLNQNWQVIPDQSLVHFSVSPHLNHRHVAEAEFARTRFFDAFLKGEGAFPVTPELTVNLATSDGTPVATVKPDAPDQVQRVQIYYSINPHSLTRFWRRAETIRDGGHWKAPLPIVSTSMPLFVMANVEYPQPRPLIGAPGLAQSPKTFLVSTWEKAFDPPALKAAGVKETDRPERMIQATFDDWGDWFQIGWPNTQHALAATRKLTDPKWRGPDGATLSIDVKDPQGGHFLMTFAVNQWSAYSDLKPGDYYCVKPLARTEDWQTVTIALSDLKPRKSGIPALPASWQGITELGIVAGLHKLPGNPESILSGGTWPGNRQLRNLRWTGGDYAAPLLYPGGRLSVEAFQKIFQDDIDKSIELEKKDARQGANSEVAESTAGTGKSGAGGPNRTGMKFGNRQLTVTIAADGDLAAISDGKRETESKKGIPLFTVTLAEKVYGLDTGKRRTLKLKPVKQEGDRITLAPENEALPTFTFRTIDKGSYIVIKLVSVENPSREQALMLTMQRISGTGWLPLDCVTKQCDRIGNNPTFFGVVRRSKSNPLGSIALWSLKGNEENDETLYQIWANEEIPHPKVEGEWTVARAKQWVSDYIEMRKVYATEMYIGPRAPEDLKPLADEAKKFGIRRLYMHLNTWAGRYWASNRDNLEVNEKLFPGGRKDMESFSKYLMDNGMRLTFRTTSYALGNEHPQYLGKVPDERLATWWQGTLAKDTDANANEITVAEGKEQPTLYPMTFHEAAGNPVAMDQNRLSGFAKRESSEIGNRNCMRIGDELVAFAKYKNNGDGTWTLMSCQRGLYNTDAGSHKAGERARGLYRAYGFMFAPDPDSTLLEELAERFGEFHNDVRAGNCNFDALEVHVMMFPYGESKFMGEVYRHIDHPVIADTSGGNMNWGFMEHKFHSVQSVLDPTLKERPPGIPAGELKIALHQSHWSASSPYAYCYGFTQMSVAGLEGHVSAQSGFHDLTMETIKGHGLMEHYEKTFKQWRELGPGLPQQARKRIFSSWYKNPFSNRFPLVDELFRFEGTGDERRVIPFRMMKREGIDRGWTCHQEHGTIYPYQYMRPGQDAIRLTNPYRSQVPEFILRVMPDFNREISAMRLGTKGETKDEKAFNDMLDKFQGASGVKLEEKAAEDLSGKNISYRIMPDPAKVKNKGSAIFTAEGGGIRITGSNDTTGILTLVTASGDTLPFYEVDTDITKAGGLGIVIDGDDSGATLVVRISGQGTRDYVVHLDFKGKRYIEIPSPQASWADARWPFFDAYKRWRGNSISRISLGIDGIKPHGKASVVIEDLRFLPEKASSLIDPVIHVGKGGITIKGAVPSDRYLWYQGGSEVGVYDLNWNKLENLPVLMSDAEAASGEVAVSVTNHNKESSPWLEAQFFVKDDPLVPFPQAGHNVQ